MIDNKKEYSSQAIVQKYKSQVHILKPEELILDYVKKSSKKTRMVDIGVGTGRTTKYFAPFFEDYIGVDYSEGMIEFCKEEYKGEENTSFIVADARVLSQIKSDSADFIFFSFNGIDCVDEKGRKSILKEVRRIGKKDSFFAFSAHNLYNIPKLFSFQIPKNPFNWMKEYQRYKGVNNHNDLSQLLLVDDIVKVKDGDGNKFDFEYVYICPTFQTKQLSELGFVDTKLFSLTKEIVLNSEVSKVKDPWIHYLSRIEK
jgi:ubiquinone/menaquinone biosynthesis C-methylase UbiE